MCACVFVLCVYECVCVCMCAFVCMCACVWCWCVRRCHGDRATYAKVNDNNYRLRNNKLRLSAMNDERSVDICTEIRIRKMSKRDTVLLYVETIIV